MKNQNLNFSTPTMRKKNILTFATATLSRILMSIIMIAALATFNSCEQDDLDPMDNPDSILPTTFSVDIPSSISSNVTVKSGSVDTLMGNDIYEHLRNFINVGELGAELTEGVIQMIALNNLSRPMELTFISDDDNRTKHLKIIENASFEGETWQYRMTVRDAEGITKTQSTDIAIQVFWNNNPVKGIAILNPYNIDRNTEEEYIFTNFRVDYSEAGEMGYEKHMIVAFGGFPIPSPLIEPYAISKMKMFVGKDGDMISIYGNSEHPNAKFFSGETGFDWAFVAAASESNNISVAEVGLPPMSLDATERTTLLEMYSIRNVFSNQITSVWPGIDQGTLDAYLYYTAAPGYFNAGGFVQGSEAPSDLYNPLENEIKGLTPYNPAHILGLEINFATE